MSKYTTDDRLNAAMEHISFPARKRVSNRGVPHIVGDFPDGTSFSVTWFWKYRNYVVFWPYMQFDKPQNKTYSKSAYGLIEAIKHVQFDNGYGREA